MRRHLVTAAVAAVRLCSFVTTRGPMVQAAAEAVAALVLQ